MNPKPLSSDQKMVIHDHSETLLEIVNGMSVEELSCFDNYFCTDLPHYLSLQCTWLEDEEYLVGSRIGHKPSAIELLDDIEKYHTPTRFRAYYTMKFPDKMIHRDRLRD